MPSTVAVCASLLFAASGYASFPGRNGLIAVPTLDESFVAPAAAPNRARPLTGIKNAVRLAWSRDGKRLLVSTYSQIYVTDRAGKRLPAFPVIHQEDGQATWSRRGNAIVFREAHKHCDGQLILFAFSNRRRVQLTPCDGARLPAWSPTAPLIAYRAGFEPVKLLDLRTAKTQTILSQLDGPLAAGDSVDNGAPSWSPDGKEVAYSTGRTIAAYNVSSGQTRTIIPANADGLAMGSVAWAPDGQRIAFTHDAPTFYGDTILAVANADGGAARDYFGPGTFGTPDWQAIVN